jgi:hypothetical protein
MVMAMIVMLAGAGFRREGPQLFWSGFEKSSEGAGYQDEYCREYRYFHNYLGCGPGEDTAPAVSRDES